MDAEAREKAAVEFFRMAASGRAREAADRFLVPGCVHHNPHFAAGMEALIEAGEADAKDAHLGFPAAALGRGGRLSVPA